MDGTRRKVKEDFERLLKETKIEAEHLTLIRSKLDSTLCDSQETPLEISKAYLKGFLSAMYLMCKEFTYEEYAEMRVILG